MQITLNNQTGQGNHLMDNVIRNQNFVTSQNNLGKTKPE